MKPMRGDRRVGTAVIVIGLFKRWFRSSGKGLRLPQIKSRSSAAKLQRKIGLPQGCCCG